MKHRRSPVHTYRMLDVLLASPTEPLPEAKRVHQLTRMWLGLAQIERAQQPSIDDWRVCSDAVNLMETFIRQLGVSEDASGLLDDAVKALADAGRRHHQGRPLRLNAAGIQAVRAVLEDYAELLEQLPARIVIQAHRLTERRIQQILAGQRQAHDVEVIDL